MAFWLLAPCFSFINEKPASCPMGFWLACWEFSLECSSVYSYVKYSLWWHQTKWTKRVFSWVSNRSLPWAQAVPDAHGVCQSTGHGCVMPALCPVSGATITRVPGCWSLLPWPAVDSWKPHLTPIPGTGDSPSWRWSPRTVSWYCHKQTFDSAKKSLWV